MSGGWERSKEEMVKRNMKDTNPKHRRVGRYHICEVGACQEGSEAQHLVTMTSEWLLLHFFPLANSNDESYKEVNNRTLVPVLERVLGCLLHKRQSNRSCLLVLGNPYKTPYK